MTDAPASAAFRRLVSAGAGCQVLGLVVDAWLHARDPGRAEREGVLTLTNPGHALFAGGLALVLGAAVMPSLLSHLRSGHAGRARVLGMALLAPTVAALVVAAASSPVVDGHHGAPGEDPAVTAARARAERLLPGLSHDHASASPVRPLDAPTRVILGGQLTEARAVAMRYPTVADAVAAGYRLVVPYVPLVAAHYLRWDLLDRPFQIDAPAILLYDGTDPSSPIVGLSYYVQGPTAPEGFAGGADRWHRHLSLCVDSGDVVVGGDQLPASKCRALGGTELDGSEGWMLHAWVVPGWESPQGVFSAENDQLL